MNEFLSFFLIVFIISFNAFCSMSPPPIFGPSPPEGVEFSECLFLPKITGDDLTNAFYSYRHICREKFSDNASQQTQRERIWYFVGRLDKVFETTSLDLARFHYVPIEQSLIQFVFLNRKTLMFSLRSTDRNFQITFQSVQQRNAFYGMIYADVNLSKAAPNKIDVLHEMKTRENVNIANNVEALQERINYIWYITFKNDQGEPLFVSCQNDVAISRISRAQDKLQLLMRVHGTHYILTFSSGVEAKQFSDGLLEYVKVLHLGRVHSNVRSRFQDNQITINPQDV